MMKVIIRMWIFLTCNFPPLISKQSNSTLHLSFTHTPLPEHLSKKLLWGACQDRCRHYRLPPQFVRRPWKCSWRAIDPGGGRQEGYPRSLPPLCSSTKTENWQLFHRLRENCSKFSIFCLSAKNIVKWFMKNSRWHPFLINPAKKGQLKWTNNWRSLQQQHRILGNHWVLQLKNKRWQKKILK